MDDMTVTLDVQRNGDVAVLRGLDDERALLHLCRSLVAGSVFDAYRGLVIDLQGGDLPAAAAAALDSATAACVRRGQWLSTTSATVSAATAVAQARKWLRLVDDRDRGVSSVLRRLIRALP